MPNRTYYDVLGVSVTADQETIRSTYLRLLQIYHPDHNRDPAASLKTTELIEAYGVLGDATKRKAYDDSLLPRSASASPRPASHRSAAPLAEVVCMLCGVQDSSLRTVLMYWVVSLILVTQRGTKGGIWCERCRVKQSALWTVLTGTLGWWGFPWGPIYTSQALYYNAVGGHQDKTQNAALLRMVAYQLNIKGKRDQALEAIEASIALQDDGPSRQFATSLRGVGLTPPLPRISFRIATAIPSVVVLAVIIFAVAAILNEPTGYAARYEPPKPAPTRFAPPAAVTKGRQRVNDLVESLADAVHEHATYVGQHQQGSAVINDYQLDRKKYDSQPFSNLADQISPFLDDPGANGDGFASSAYFNARLMGLSVDIVNGLRAGHDVNPLIQSVYAIKDELAASGWLDASPTFKPYSDLVKRLLAIQRTKGTFGASDDGEMTKLASSIAYLKSQAQDARQIGDIESAEIAAKLHDQQVERYNSLVKRHNRMIKILNGLDLAFNQCLDPKILMSKFQEVDLTSDLPNQAPATETP